MIDIEDVCERRRQKSLIGNDFKNELKQKESVYVNLRFRSVKTTIGVLTLPSPLTVDANTVMLYVVFGLSPVSLASVVGVFTTFLRGLPLGSA